jgi:hypothetical protein
LRRGFSCDEDGLLDTFDLETDLQRVVVAGLKIDRNDGPAKARGGRFYKVASAWNSRKFEPSLNAQNLFDSLGVCGVEERQPSALDRLALRVNSNTSE